MRAVFLTLLSANLLFLAWARWIDTPRDTSMQDALSRLPRLQLVTEAPRGAKPRSGAARKMALRQPEPARCTSVGPFNDMASAARTAATLVDRGFQPRQRAEEGETLEGYWVFVSGMRSDDEVLQVARRLEKSGFTDAHVMRESLEGRRISVGLFSQRERAERRAKAVEHMGLIPQIAERKFPGTVYWVDVGLGSGVQKLPTEVILADSGSGKLKVRVQACPPEAPMVKPEQAAPVPGDDDGEGEGGITRSLPRTTVASVPKPE